MNQTMSTDSCGEAAESGNRPRVATKELVTIGQRWRRRARSPKARHEIVITQVHRADKEIEAYRISENGPVVGSRERIRLTVLRKQYALVLTKLPTGGKMDK